METKICTHCKIEKKIKNFATFIQEVKFVIAKEA